MPLTDDDRRQIEAVHHAWLRAETSGDHGAVLDLCTDAAVWQPQGEPPLCGRDAIRAWLLQQPPVAIRRIDVDALEIGGHGSVAWKSAAFRTEIETEDAAGVQVVTGVHAWLLRRTSAGWRVAFVTWSIE